MPFSMLIRRRLGCRAGYAEALIILNFSTSSNLWLDWWRETRGGNEDGEGSDSLRFRNSFVPPDPVRVGFPLPTGLVDIGKYFF